MINNTNMKKTLRIIGLIVAFLLSSGCAGLYIDGYVTVPFYYQQMPRDPVLICRNGSQMYWNWNWQVPYGCMLINSYDIYGRRGW